MATLEELAAQYTLARREHPDYDIEDVVALIADETIDGKILEYSLFPIAVRTRDEQTDMLTEKLTISRTITQKVMREKVALLSQDAKTDAQFSGADSIVSQGVRSTICAPTRRPSFARWSAPTSTPCIRRRIST